MGSRWKAAVREAIQRVIAGRSDPVFTRQELIQYELRRIDSESQTRSWGKNLTQGLSACLQNLRDEGALEFLNRGRYRWLGVRVPPFVDLELANHTDEEIDSLLRTGRLRIEFVEATTEVALLRRRRGQDRLRERTLANYEKQCALCDVDDLRLLVASHIVPWAEDSQARGRLDNCMCLCKFHDALFETGYWSLGEDFEVLVTGGIESPTIRKLLGKGVCFRKPLSHIPAQEYLARHRQKHGFADSRWPPNMPAIVRGML